MRPEFQRTSLIESLITARWAVLLAALTWVGGPGVAQAQDDRVTISASELQRMVYSAHLLTQFDGKPELDAGLQVLLELQRRNPQADPLALADLTRQTLQVYRTNAPAYLRSQGFRDENLAAYLDALRQVPARTNFVPATMQLLGYFMLGPGDYATASGAALIHSGNQRLLKAERAPVEREALVESCAARGASNAVFGRALDAVLGPELGLLAAQTPAQVLSLNPALSNSPTMQTLLARSLGSGDGSVTITTNELKSLFAQEMAILHGIINTNMAMEQAMMLAQGDLPSYLTNTAQVEANVQWETAVKQGQGERAGAAYAGVNSISALSASKWPALGRAMGGLGKGVKILTDAFTSLSKTSEAASKGASIATGFGKVLSAANFAAGILSITGSIMEIAGVFQDPNDVILQEIAAVKSMIDELSNNMNYRFDRVDQSLNQLGESMDEVLDRLAYSINLIGQVGHEVTEVRQGIVDVQTDLHRLERHLNLYLNQLYGRFQNENLNYYLGFESTYGHAMGQTDFEKGEVNFFTQAFDNSHDDLASPSLIGRDFTAAGLYSELTETGGGTSNRLDQNLSYIKHYLDYSLDTQHGAFTAGSEELPNPREWFVGTYAYIQLAAENPMYFRQVNVSNRLDLIAARGRELPVFLRSLTFEGSGTNINWPLHNALLRNYTNKLGSFVNQVHTSEQQYATLTNFALETWRSWSATAPRMSAESTQVRASDPNVPLVGQPNRARRVAAGGFHNLALRTDGTVIAWGMKNSGQATIPTTVSNCIAIAAGGYHSLALRTNGTIVGWGNNSLAQASVPARASNAVAIAAGSYHSLALLADSTVAGWGDTIHTLVPESATNVVAIAAGDNHSLALRADGTVVAWGGNDFGQTDIPPGTTNIVAIAAGGYSSIALRSDGTVVGWGDVPSIPAAVANVVAIAGGDFHYLALKADGTVVGWGYDYALYQISPPVGLKEVVAISAGMSHSVALKADGTVVAWGDNTQGQCIVPSLLTWQRAISGRGHYLALREDGTVVGWNGSTYGVGVSIPANLTNAVAVSAGGTHSLALRADGTVAAWGSNTYSQITIPAGLNGAVAVAAGWNHSLAVTATGTVYGWGDNTYGQRQVPAAATDVVVIAAGYNHSLALRRNGTVVGWGRNTTEWGTWAGQATVPAGLSNVVGIAAGDSFSVALRGDGTVVAWGDNMDGQTNTTGLNGVMAITAGYMHGLALCANGTVFTWGSWGPSVFGNNVIAMVAGDSWDALVRPGGSVLLPQVNLWDSSKTTVPTLPPAVTKVAAGYDQSLVLHGNGTVTAFGGNGYGDCTPPAGLSDVVDIAAGFYFSLALKGDGTVVAWGDRQFGRTSIPGGLNNAVAIAAGTWHGLALRADGTVVGWGGQNSPWIYGQEIPPAGLKDVLAIAAGFGHSLALKANGTVVGWGNNSYGQITIPAGLQNVVAIAAGPRHNLALLANGQVVAWGLNDVGQTDVPLAARSNVVAIAAGGYHNLALRQDGTVVNWGGQGVSRFPVPSGLSNVVTMAAGYYHSLFVTANPASGPSTVPLTLRQIPTRVGYLLAGSADRVVTDLSGVGGLRSAAVELAGAKVLIQAVLELGMPYTMERDDVLHGYFYGSEALMDLGVATNLFSAESSRMLATPQARPLVLEEVIWPRASCFANRLNDRLRDLAATGQPELPRLLGHTLTLCNVLRDAWAGVPRPALEISIQTNKPWLVLYGEPYVRYNLSYSDELGLPGWTSITNLVNQQSFGPPVSSGPRRFYRAGVYAP